MREEIHGLDGFYATPTGLVAARLLRERLRAFWPSLARPVRARPRLRQPLSPAVARGGGALRRAGAAAPAALALAAQGAQPHRRRRGGRAALPRPLLRPHPPRPRAGNRRERPPPAARSLARAEGRRQAAGGGAEPPQPLGATGTHALRPRPALLAGPARSGCSGGRCSASSGAATPSSCRPSTRRLLLRGAEGWERVGPRLFPRFAGLTLVEAEKDMFAALPVPAARGGGAAAAAAGGDVGGGDGGAGLRRNQPVMTASRSLHVVRVQRRADAALSSGDATAPPPSRLTAGHFRRTFRAGSRPGRATWDPSPPCSAA